VSLFFFGDDVFSQPPPHTGRSTYAAPSQRPAFHPRRRPFSSPQRFLPSSPGPIWVIQGFYLLHPNFTTPPLYPRYSWACTFAGPDLWQRHHPFSFTHPHSKSYDPDLRPNEFVLFFRLPTAQRKADCEAGFAPPFTLFSHAILSFFPARTLPFPHDLPKSGFCVVSWPSRE